MAQQIYQVPDSANGKSLSQLFPNSSVQLQHYGEWGVNPNSPLQSGQYLTFNMPDNYVNSGETQLLGQTFGNTVDPAVASADQLNKFTIKANQPYISQLQGEITPTQNAYQSIIDQIQKASTNAVNNNTVALKREYAARGIPTDSLSATQDINNSNSQVQQPFLTNAANTTGAETSAINGINSAIGQLQAGSPSSAISSALSQEQITNNQNIAQAQLGLQQSQQAFNQRYVTTPFGIYDLQTGKVLAGFGANSGSSPALNGQIVGTY